MTEETRKQAGWLLILLPTVIFGGVSLLSLFLGNIPGYLDNPVRRDLWRAGHAHAGILLIVSLIALLYIDHANLSNRLKSFVRSSIPLSAILLPVAFFLSVASPDATEPNALIYLAYVGGASLTAGLLVVGYGLVKKNNEINK